MLAFKVMISNQGGTNLQLIVTVKDSNDAIIHAYNDDDEVVAKRLS